MQAQAAYFEDTFRVFDWEADACRRMTPGAILRRAQQVATDHCDALGIGAEQYEQTHTAFLMAKVAVESRRPMLTGETIRIETRPSCPVRAAFHRLIDFIGADGAVCCTVDSRWVLVDTQTRRILRQPPEALGLPFTEPPQRELDMGIAKGQALPVGEQRAFYSYCDVNGHMNNTRYADLVCDLAPAEEILARPFRRLAIAYHNEVPLGMSVEVSRAAVENGWYFLGQADGKKRFEAQLTLESPKTRD